MNLNYKDVQKLELTVTTEQIDNNEDEING